MMMRTLPGKRWRWRVHLQAACRVVKWRLSTRLLAAGYIVIDQFPELCWEIGEHVVEWPGPDDLGLVALVSIGGKMMPLEFEREPGPELPHDPADPRTFGPFEKADPCCKVCGKTFCHHGQE